MATAELPHDLIALFNSPNDLSARAGETLAKFYKDNADAMEMVVPALTTRKRAGEKFEAEDLLNYIYASVATRTSKEKKCVLSAQASLPSINRQVWLSP